MDIFLQSLINSIALGAIYAILALSFTILFGTLRIAHFAQGDIYMIGMLLGYTFYVTSTLPLAVSIILSVIITSAILLIIQRTIYRQILKASPMYLFIATIGMATFLRNAAQVLFGAEGYSFPHLLGSMPWQITPTLSIMPQSVIIIAVSIVLSVALMLFMRLTKPGLAMSAISMNQFAASVMGVNFTRITTLTYVISASMAAIAGIITAPLNNVNVQAGVGVGGRALVAAILGGFGNAPGAIIGGVLLGIIETFGSYYISSAYKDAFAFIVLIVLLFVRPQGILGRKRITKV